ncbi:MAG: hypothetical protein M1327_06790 [Candidatus Thermoplasmatota archaeon]|nr:hypothetical protein [Candidatus Thermoplasmatota archaeon]
MTSKMQETIMDEMSNGGKRFLASIHSDNRNRENGKVTYDLSGNRLKVTLAYEHQDEASGIAETMQHLMQILMQIYLEEDEFNENIARIKDAGINSISFIP